MLPRLGLPPAGAPSRYLPARTSYLAFRAFAHPDAAPGTDMAVPTCRNRDGRTQWTSLSAPVEKRASGDAEVGTRSIVTP